MLERNETDLHLREFSFERSFDERGAIEWMQANWSKSFVFSAVYAALVFGGRYYMKPRPRMNLRLPLILWSLSLALFSILGALRTGSYMFQVLSVGGFRRSVCDQSFYNGPVSKFWAYAFVLSKAPELGDTAFVVLRKQKLLFLHWYHHITVLLYSWYSYKDLVAGGGWFMTMNYGVHALMYSYYAARASGLRVPRPLAALITGAQMGQMAMGLAVSGLVYRWAPRGDCPSRAANVRWAALMYLSYLLLFANFFYHTYLRQTAQTAKTAPTAKTAQTTQTTKTAQTAKTAQTTKSAPTTKTTKTAQTTKTAPTAKTTQTAKTTKTAPTTKTTKVE